MADTVGRAVLQITVDNTELVRGLQEVNRHADDSAKHLKGIGTGVDLLVFKEFGRIAVDAIKRTAEAIVELGERGAKVADVRESFAGLTAGVRSTSEEMLGSLQRGVQGTLSDFDLMQRANRLLGSGLKLTAADMETLSGGARLLAKRTGHETVEAFDALTKAMITGKTKGLGEFGLGIKDGTKLLDELRSQVAQTGSQVLDFGEQIQLVRVAFNNLRDSAAVVVARVMPDIIAQFKGLSFGAGDLTASVRFMVNVIGNGMVTAVGIAVNSVKQLVAVMQAAGSTISSQAEQMWGMLTGKIGIKEGLQTIFAVTRGGLAGIKAAISGVLNPTLTWKDYLEDVGKTSTVVADRHEKNGKKIKATHYATLESARDLMEGLRAMGDIEVKNEQTAAEAMAAAMKQAMDKMLSAQNAWYVKTMDMASLAGFKTRDELQANAAKALETYQRMKDSDLYTKGEQLKAHEAYVKAKEELDGTYSMGAMEKYQMISSAASGMLRTMFGKSKAAAIAAVLIDTAAAIVSSFKNAGGFPWGIIPAALMAAQAAVQISKIKSQGAQGFKTGTPWLDFQSFGSVSPAFLHGEEAVVPRGQGHVLASEIAAAMPKPGADRAQLHRLDRIAAGIDSLPGQMKRAFRDGLLLARA